MKNSLLIYLCYLARHHLHLKAEARIRLLQMQAQQLKPWNEEFYQLMPEFRIFQERTKSFWRQGEDEIKRYRQRGFVFLTPEDEDYPVNLRCMNDPPWVLSVIGNPKVLSEPCLSVVGAREPLAESLVWMDEQLGIVLKKAPLVLVSGGARGIDQRAHQLSLRAARPTVLFLPSGLLQLYPQSLCEWMAPVLETGGAFVSEFHPRAPMRKWHFQMRNRLIAGLSWDTLVVEARYRSGTWLTARLALEMGRGLCVVQGSAMEPKQSGNVILIAEGAAPLTNAQDLVIFLQARCQEQIRICASLGASISMTH